LRVAGSAVARPLGAKPGSARAFGTYLYALSRWATSQLERRVRTATTEMCLARRGVSWRRWWYHRNFARFWPAAGRFTRYGSLGAGPGHHVHGAPAGGGWNAALCRKRRPKRPIWATLECCALSDSEAGWGAL